MTNRTYGRKAIRIGMLIAGLLTFALFALAGEKPSSMYQAKCATCHGKKGEGKPSSKTPSLVSDEVRNMSDKTLRGLITSRANGEIERDKVHTSQKGHLTEEQIQQIISEVRRLQAQHR